MYRVKGLLERSHFNGHIIGFHAQTQKLRVGLHTKINSTIEKYC